jgi:hypothetical protein
VLPPIAIRLRTVFDLRRLPFLKLPAPANDAVLEAHGHAAVDCQ